MSENTWEPESHFLSSTEETLDEYKRVHHLALLYGYKEAHRLGVIRISPPETDSAPQTSACPPPLPTTPSPSMPMTNSGSLPSFPTSDSTALPTSDLTLPTVSVTDAVSRASASAYAAAIDYSTPATPFSLLDASLKCRLLPDGKLNWPMVSQLLAAPHTFI
ncbi:hypothetical protein DAEQUDRAFT_766680 [Daedalea quercina L-15889]|uniref:Uncharacterized protein n=1 Tax=Daedalea quercina L-15889 TaxID=1314783 RepID=A0A165PEI6_9APHY|nr:hypothetical protein DAEQUDRAFT_766680 [Daedalea quercina L-15889]